MAVASRSTRRCAPWGGAASPSWSTAAALSARRLADAVGDEVEVLNDVTLNQVLLGFGDDERTAAAIAALQADGTFWAGGTRWHDQAALRFSVSNWSTSEEDIDRCAEAILTIARQARG